MRNFKGLTAVAVVILAIGLAPAAKADLIISGTGTAADGAALSATVDFSLIGNDFRIVLTNNNPSISPGSVLTNLGVTVAPAPGTALPSASGTIALTSGSAFLGGPVTFTLGQTWAYLTGGAASSGFGVGTGQGNLCGSTVCDGQALDGASYGLVGPGTDLALAAINAQQPYVEDSVTIDIFLAAGSTFTLADITNVSFQYGTSPGEGQIDCTVGVTCGGGGGGGQGGEVPEPASLVVLGTALVGFGILSRRRRRV